ncbi:MAG: cytochrome c [Pseudomonadota bacterium]
MKTKTLVAALAVTCATSAGAQDAKTGEELFVKFCSFCHGYEAKGDGWNADKLEVPPADLTRLSVENGGVFPLARTAYRIDGRELVAAHGGEMPFYGDIMGEPLVEMEADGEVVEMGQAIADLITYIQGLQEEVPES